MLVKSLDWINKHLIATLLLVAGLRLLFLYYNGLDLLGDESYYWDWSRQPDWCYYSKPPMVAWIIALFTGVLGDSAFAVRLPTIVLGSVFLAYFHATAKAFYGERAAAFALLLVLATPINLVANFLMTIDPPLYCFWIISIYYLQQALFKQSAAAWWWAGLASAAALLSKQVAIALPLILWLFLLIDGQRRHYLKREYWFYLLPIVVVSLIIVFWNQQHGWVMFEHSKEHFEQAEGVSVLKHLQHARDFWLYQLLLMTPVLLALVLLLTAKMLLQFRALSAEQRFLWLMGPMLLVAIVLMSFTQKLQGNWPMPFYFSALILLAGYWQAGHWQKLSKAALSLGYLMVLITCFLPFLLAIFNLQRTAWDPTKRFKSWQQVAATIHQQRLQVLPELDDTFVVALGHRSIASQLAFYLPDHPKVYRLEESGQVLSQYEVWGGPTQSVGKNAFIVAQVTEANLPKPLQTAFKQIRFIAQVVDPNKANSIFYLYFAEQLQAWPVITPAR